MRFGISSLIRSKKKFLITKITAKITEKILHFLYVKTDNFKKIFIKEQIKNLTNLQKNALK